MSKLYTAQTRFLTFEEAALLERSITALLQNLEHVGQSESQEAVLARQLLRDFVYFTSADSLEEFKGYLQKHGWVIGISVDPHYQVLFAPEEQSFGNGERISLLLPTWMKWSEAEGMIIRAMHFLAALEEQEDMCPYDILLRIRASQREEHSS